MAIVKHKGLGSTLFTAAKEILPVCTNLGCIFQATPPVPCLTVVSVLIKPLATYDRDWETM